MVERRAVSATSAEVISTTVRSIWRGGALKGRNTSLRPAVWSRLRSGLSLVSTVVRSQKRSASASQALSRSCRWHVPPPTA
eukprot:848540-Prorocentrum_lima.AAC.1